MSVGKNIRIARHMLGLTLEELADKIGTTKQHVYRWEHQIINPGGKYISRLSRALGISLSEMYGEPPLSLSNDSDEYRMLQKAIASPKARRRLLMILPYLRTTDEEVWMEVMRVVKRGTRKRGAVSG